MGMRPTGNSDVVQCESCTAPYYLVTAEKRCSNLGTATQVGSVTEFGVSEGGPGGLAVIGDTLYMVGYGNDALYILDISDDGAGTLGGATRVGSVQEFGVGETDVSGIAALNGTLYMVGWGQRKLYTLDITNDGVGTLGGATRIGNVDKFDVNEVQPDGLVALNGTLYMTGATADALYTLDVTDDGMGTLGGATRVGRAHRFDVNETGAAGLAAIGDTLYMVGYAFDALYALDITDDNVGVLGGATRVGSASEFEVRASGPEGLAAIGSTLYMVDAMTDLLYTVVYRE